MTVRLDSALASALERHCLENSTTKGEVVVRSLSAYLWGGPVASHSAPNQPRRESRLYKAFERAGLVGAGELGGRSADKATVRARAVERIRQRPGR